MGLKYNADGSLADMTDKEVVDTTKRWGMWAFIIGVVLAVVIPAAVWGISVATSNTAGRGNAVKLKNNASNRTQAQALFHTRFEGIKALDQKLTDAQGQLDAFNKAHPNVGNGTAFDPLLEQQSNFQRSVTGAQQQCRNAVADYNASTETFTLRDFKDSDLPFKIDGGDPVFTDGTASFADFDCQPNAGGK
jgi:hypothetical protein